MKRHAVIIGIDHPRDKRLSPLRCAEKDAREMLGFLHRLRFDVVRHLLGPEATLNRVLDELDTAMAGLEERDLLTFYFAGHGVTEGPAHYLMCWDARNDPDLAANHVGMLGVHTLVDRMRRSQNFSRLIITDACRERLEAGRHGGSVGFRGGACYRNLAGSGSSDNAGHVLLNSCEDDKLARELEDHGLFTRAMLDLWTERVGSGSALWVNGAFRDELGQRMRRLAETAGFDPEEQWPLLEEGRPLPCSLDGVASSKAEPVPAADSKTSDTGPRPESSAPRPSARPALRKHPRSDEKNFVKLTSPEPDLFCSACGKRFLTDLDCAGRCQYTGCTKPICNHCWTVLGEMLCREHQARP